MACSPGNPGTDVGERFPNIGLIQQSNAATALAVRKKESVDKLCVRATDTHLDNVRNSKKLHKFLCFIMWTE